MYSLFAVSLTDLQCGIIVGEGGIPYLIDGHSIYALGRVNE